MTTLPPVIGKLVGDNTDYIRSLNQAESATKGSTDTSAGHFGKLGGAIGTAMKVGAAAGGVAVAGFLAKAVMGASDLAETMSKVGVVFGESAGQVTGFANKMAKDFGLPKGAILDAASSIGLIGKASGLSQADAGKMSTELAKMAADASSFYNVPLPEALQAIQSGLVGEAEPMRRFGVLLNEQAVSAEAARLGLTKVNGEYTEGAKAQARASLIMSGMKDATGDLERTQGSLSNRMRELKGRFENFATDAGTLVIPVILKLFDAFEAGAARLAPIVELVQGGVRAMFAAFNAGDGDVTSSGFAGQMEKIGNAARAVVEWVEANWPRIQATIASVLETTGALLSAGVEIMLALWNNFGEQIINYVQVAFDAAMQIVGGAMDVIQGIVATVTAIIHGDWSGAWDGIVQILDGAWSIINGLVDAAMNIMQTAISIGMEIAGSIISSAFEGIVGFVASIPGRILGALGDLGGLLYGAGVNLIQGLMSGIMSMAGQAADAARRVVQSAISAAWNAIKPGSPSRVGRAMGENFGEGIEAGLLGMRRAVASASGQLAGAGVSGGMGSVAAGGAVTGGGSRAGAIINIYTATGDIPDETIRKIRSALFELGNDVPMGSLLPGAA